MQPGILPNREYCRILPNLCVWGKANYRVWHEISCPASLGQIQQDLGRVHSNKRQQG